MKVREIDVGHQRVVVAVERGLVYLDARPVLSGRLEIDMVDARRLAEALGDAAAIVERNARLAPAPERAVEMRHWYDLGGARRKLTEAEAGAHAGAVRVKCPACIYELERGEPIPSGADHACADTEPEGGELQGEQVENERWRVAGKKARERLPRGGR
jgi:hypothetical protein